MKSHLYHVQINIEYTRHIGFYKNLMEFLGWSIIFEKEDDVIGYHSEHNGDVWIANADKAERSDYDAIGVNHVAFRVERVEDVSEAERFLQAQGITVLFETPRHRSEFAKPGETYYQIIFESPDKIQFEIVYIGPKA